jgi:predicted O-methyltransferase YrrM
MPPKKLTQLLVQTGPACFQCVDDLVAFTHLTGTCRLQTVTDDDGDDVDDVDDGPMVPTQPVAILCPGSIDVGAQHYVNEPYCPQKKIGGGLWLSGIALMLFIDANRGLFRGRHVLELGAGLGLAGLHVARVAQPASVVISDVDVTPARNALRANHQQLENDEKVILRTLDFVEIPAKMDCCFDVIIASDCVYRTNQDGVVATIAKYLKPGGTLVMFNADRSNAAPNLLYAIQEIVELDPAFPTSVELNMTLAPADGSCGYYYAPLLRIVGVRQPAYI